MAKKSSKSKNTSKSSGRGVGIGIGLTTAAVAAASAYFLYGSPNAAKNRKKVRGWMLRAKGEVLEALEKAEEMTEKEYQDLVNSVTKTYIKLQHVSKGDVDNFRKEMMSHWKNISKQVGKKAKTAKKSVKKAAKKAKKSAKKSAKKTSKKK